MWRYPASSAARTAAPTSPAGACHVPSPMSGIFAPVHSVAPAMSAGVAWYVGARGGPKGKDSVQQNGLHLLLPTAGDVCKLFGVAPSGASVTCWRSDQDSGRVERHTGNQKS